MLEIIFSVLASAVAICVTIGGAAWKLSGRINRSESHLSGRIDGVGGRIDGLEKRVDDLKAEVHSINEHLRQPRG